MEDSFNSNTWTVVHFTEEDNVEAVPSAWIIGKNKCLWPPRQWTSEKVRHAIKSSSFNTCWESFTVNIFKNATCSDYETALQKSRKAEMYSDLNTDTENKRIRMPSRKFDSSPDTDDGDNAPLALLRNPPKFKNENIRKSLFSTGSEGILSKKRTRTTDDLAVLHKTTSPDAIPKTKNSVSKRSIDSSSHLRDKYLRKENLSWSSSEVESPTSSVERSKKRRYPTEAYTKDISPERILNKQFRESNTSKKIPSTRVGDSSDSGHLAVRDCKSCCSYQTGLLRHLIKQQTLTGILSDMQQNYEQSLAAKIKPVSPTNKQSIFDDFNMPFEDEDNLMQFDNFLNDQTKFDKAILEISRFGGKDNADYVKRCLTQLMTNKLAINYSWMGRRFKKCFKDTFKNVVNLIIVSAEQTSKAKDRKETEELIKYWLRRAGERNRKDVLNIWRM